MVVNRHNDEAPGTILCAPLVGCASVNGILRAMFDRQMERWAPPQPGNRALLVGVAVVVALVYLTFRSVSLDDFDSYSFALALNDFDISLQQPQPPGFPVYVALGRVVFALTGNASAALTVLSALSGVVSVAVVYAIGRQLAPRDPLVGILGALCLAFVPVSWLTAEKALSDMPGLAWTLLALWQWQLWRLNVSRDSTAMAPVAAALITGIALGVRPQNALPILAYVAFCFLCDVRNRHAVRHWAIGAAFVVLGILLWLIPTAVASNGLAAYLAEVRAHAGHIGRADSLWALGEPLLRALRIRGFAMLDTFLVAISGTGRATTPAVGLPLPWVLIAGFCLVGIIKANWRSRNTQWLGLWVLLTAAQVFVFETLDRPRLLLPLFPPLSLLVASGWAHVSTARAARAGLVALPTLGLLLQTLPWAAMLAQVPAPPSQATAHIAANYAPETTLIAAAGSFRAAQVELPDFPIVYLYRFDVDAVADALKNGPHWVAILDRDQFTPEAIDILSHHGTWVTIEDRTFSRDRRVHSQHDHVRLQILAPPDRVPASALRPGPDGCIDIGALEDGRYLGNGWYRPEEIGGVDGRWAGQELTTTLRIGLQPGRAYDLRLRVLAYPEGQTLTVRVDDVVLGVAPLPQDWNEVRFSLSADALGDRDVIELSLVHAAALAPLEATAGASNDARLLTAAYDWVCLVP